MKRIRWTCDLCNADGKRTDGRGYIDEGPGDFDDVVKKFGWVRDYPHMERKQHRWISIHVCSECAELRRRKP